MIQTGSYVIVWEREPMFFESLNRVGQAIVAEMKDEAENYSCNGCPFCCYGHESSREWCTDTGGYGRTKRDCFTYWSTVFNRNDNIPDATIHNITLAPTALEGCVQPKWDDAEPLWSLKEVCADAKRLMAFIDTGIIAFPTGGYHQASIETRLAQFLNLSLDDFPLPIADVAFDEDSVTVMAEIDCDFDPNEFMEKQARLHQHPMYDEYTLHDNGEQWHFTHKNA